MSFKYSKEVTAEQIDDLMTTALEGGITYWCDEAEVVGGVLPMGVKYLSDCLSVGETIRLHAEDDDWYELTIEKLLGALSTTNFDWDNYDSLDADAVVQKALFGEVVYG